MRRWLWGWVLWGLAGCATINTFELADGSGSRAFPGPFLVGEVTSLTVERATGWWSLDYVLPSGQPSAQRVPERGRLWFRLPDGEDLDAAVTSLCDPRRSYVEVEVYVDTGGFGSVQLGTPMWDPVVGTEAEIREAGGAPPGESLGLDGQLALRFDISSELREGAPLLYLALPFAVAFDLTTFPFQAIVIAANLGDFVSFPGVR